MNRTNYAQIKALKTNRLNIKKPKKNKKKKINGKNIKYEILVKRKRNKENEKPPLGDSQYQSRKSLRTISEVSNSASNMNSRSSASL